MSAKKGSKKSAVVKAPTKRVRPSQCKSFLQKRVAEVLPTAMDTWEEKLKEGDVAVFNAMWKASGLDKQEVKAVRRRKGRGADELRRRLDAFEAGRDERGRGER